MKKVIALLLALIMALATLTACGGNDSATQGTTKEDPGKTETTDSDKPSSDDSSKTDINGLVLPLTDEKQELTVWIVYSGTIMTDINEIAGVKKMEELTNVHINWIPVPLQEISDKYGILLASGELPDIIQAASAVYPGGYEKGVEEGIIYPDMDTLIKTYMPNYMAYLNSSEEARREATADSGKMVVAKNIVGTDGTAQSEGTYLGLAYRQDILEKLGLDVPVTVDDWHDVLTKVKESGEVEYPLMLNQDGSCPISMAWGVASSGGSYLNLENDKVSYALANDGYEDYLNTMRQWYKEGLIDPNFTSFMFYPDTPGAVENNKNFVFSTVLSMFTGKQYYNMHMINNESAILQPITAPVLNKGETQKYQWGSRIIAKDGIYITTSCKNPELAAKWLDFQYTEMGERLNWYGIENETYEIGEDGTPYFTDFVLKNPDGMAPKDVLQKYAFNQGDSWLGKHNVSANWKLSAAVTGGVNQEVEACNIWSEPPVNLYLTASISLTDEEGSSINSKYTAINTLGSEYTLNYIMGTDNTPFSEFKEKLYSYGLQDVLDVYQAAYDRYLAR